MSDPVASRSAFLCTYMSNHPDTLVAYVRHFGKVTVPVVTASMTSIDTKRMSFSYVVKGTDAKHQVSVPFDPPLSGYDEVKPRLLRMKLDAEEALGMARRPQITTFEVPTGALVTLFTISFFVYITVSSPSPSSYNIGPRIRSALGGPSMLRVGWILTVVIHVFEAIYMATLCRRHMTSPSIVVRYIVGTFLIGYPMIRRVRQMVHSARIESINKIH